MDASSLIVWADWPLLHALRHLVDTAPRTNRCTVFHLLPLLLLSFGNIYRLLDPLNILVSSSMPSLTDFSGPLVSKRRLEQLERESWRIVHIWYF